MSSAARTLHDLCPLPLPRAELPYAALASCSRNTLLRLPQKPWGNVRPWLERTALNLKETRLLQSAKLGNSCGQQGVRLVVRVPGAAIPRRGPGSLATATVTSLVSVGEKGHFPKPDPSGPF